MLGIKKEADDVPQGLQVFDSGGNLAVDVTDRLARIVGSVSTGVVNGSIVDAGLLTGTPWYTIHALSFSGYFDICSVAVSGNTLSWTFGTGGSERVAYTITYGVY